MRMKLTLTACALALAVAGAAGCRRKQPAAANGNAAANANQAAEAEAKNARPMPDNAFKAQITLPDPPAKLRAGQQERITVRIKNASDVFWWARGGELNDNPGNKFVLAAGDRWLKPDGSLVTDMDGRHGLLKDLKPGEETEVPLLISAPKEPGDYLLEVDLVQEQVAWFSDKGSPTARAKVTVVR